MGRRMTLSAENISRIQELYEAGASTKDIAEDFGVCERTIYKYLKTRKNLIQGVNVICPYYEENSHGYFYCRSEKIIKGKLIFSFSNSEECKKFKNERCIDHFQKCEFYVDAD